MPWVYSPNHSQVDWACDYLGIMTIKGIFKRMDVALNLEGDDPTRWSVEASIDTTSMESGFERRETTFRDAEWLDTERYPTMTFKSKRIERRNGDYRLVGDLTLKGVTREVAMDVRYNGEATDRRGERRRAVSTSFVIRRSDFKVGPPPEAGGAVGEDVRINLQIEGVWRD